MVLNVSSKVSPSPDLVQVGAAARGEGLGVRVEVREGVGGESAGLLRSAPDRAQTHCNHPCYNIQVELRWDERCDRKSFKNVVQSCKEIIMDLVPSRASTRGGGADFIFS